MSKHEYDRQSRVLTAQRRLLQGTSYIGATKERVKYATEEERREERKTTPTR